MLKRPTFTVSRSFNIIPAVAAQLDANQVKQLLANPDVAYIEPDYKIYALGSPDTNADSSSGINALSSSQTIPYGITMVNAPAVWPRTKGAGVRVAVMDTGISMYHPDRGNVVDSVSFVTRCNSTRGGFCTATAPILPALSRQRITISGLSGSRRRPIYSSPR